MHALFQEPVRGVRARVVRNIGRCGPFADITVDFEPSPDFEFVSLLAPNDLPPWAVQAVASGIRKELSGEVDVWAGAVWGELLPEAGPDALAVCVGLTHAAWNEIDSSEHAFEEAGRLAVRQAAAKIRKFPRHLSAGFVCECAERFCGEITDAPTEERLQRLVQLRAALDTLTSTALAEAIRQAREDGWGVRRIAEATGLTTGELKHVLPS